MYSLHVFDERGMIDDLGLQHGATTSGRYLLGLLTQVHDLRGTS